MLGYLQGHILAHTHTGIILQVEGGVGFDVLGIKLQDHPVGKQLALYTHLHLGSDNQPTLIGFGTLEARSLFRQLLKVPGVGPKTGLAVIEANTIEDIQRAIIEGDINFFTHVKGLGKKAAQKIILELKNELVDSPQLKSKYSYIFEALTSLSFTNHEISSAIKNHDLDDLSETEAIKIVLKSLGK